MTRKNTLALVVIIPMTFSAIIFGWLTYDRILGYPATPTEVIEGQLVSVHIDEPNAIYMWVVETGEKAPRAYKFPYTKDARKKSSKAAREVKKGKKTKIRIGKDKQKKTHFEFYDMPRPKWLKKDE